MGKTFRTDCAGFHRRDFLRLGSTGLLGLGLADILRHEAYASGKAKKKATSVIMIWLAGGPATIDMWDLKPEAPENIRGEFKAIPTNVQGVRICEHFSKITKVMDQCTLVRSLHHNIPEHGVGTLYMTTGNRPSPGVEFPGLGSLASHLLTASPGLPPYVTFSSFRGPGPGYLGTASAAFDVEESPERGKQKMQGMALPPGFSSNDLNNRDKLRNIFDAEFKALDKADIAASFDKFHQQALDILLSDKTRKAFDLDQENSLVRDSYGRTPFGQSALAARRLVEAGVRFVTISLGGWDTHAGNFRTLRDRLLPQVDLVVSSLVSDLKARGLLEETIVYCAGEFGRTPAINGGAGRDHWARSMAVLLAGGGFKKGTVLGSTDNQGMAPDQDPCSPDDLAATIFHRLGIEPHREVLTTSGRPMAIFREGKVIRELV